MRIISVIFSIYIITFKNIRVNPNFSLHHKGSLLARPCTITAFFYLAGAFRGRRGWAVTVPFSGGLYDDVGVPVQVHWYMGAGAGRTGAARR